VEPSLRELLALPEWGAVERRTVVGEVTTALRHLSMLYPRYAVIFALTIRVMKEDDRVDSEG